MGVHRSVDERRDFYDLETAARIANTLARSEKTVPPSQQWSYVILSDKRRPGKACVQVFDEDNAFVGYWYS